MSDTPLTDQAARLSEEKYGDDYEARLAYMGYHGETMELMLAACRDERLRARNSALGAGYNGGDLAEIITDLAEQLARVMTEKEALRKNDARYRYLRLYGDAGCTRKDGYGSYELMTGELLDLAIDALNPLRDCGNHGASASIIR